MDTEEIHLEPYNPEWPEKFKKEADCLAQALDKNEIIAIEHVGSTSIPGISAKPIIDILIGVHSLERAKAFIPILEKMGYAYWAENPSKISLYFVKGLPPNGPRTFHIHISEPGGEQWGKLLFRDYLRKHPEEVKEYETLKFDLVKKHKNDREAYNDAKTDYVSSVMEKAREEMD